MPNAATVGEKPSGVRRTSTKMVVVASSCNFLEMYDFMVFGYFARDIARAYFPTSSEFASLMLALATFGAGFLMRPVGAIVLGGYIDRRGRRSGLLLTLGLMALGTLSIAVMPTFKTIGILAPLLIVVGRLLQGLSAGATVGGVSVYLAEIAVPGREGFYVSWQSASQQAAVMLASLVGIAIVFFLPTAAVTSWGWRVPFFLGCLLIPALFWMQRALEETPAFLKRTRTLDKVELLRYVASNWKIITIGAVLVVMSTVSFYLITAYTPTYGTIVLHLPARQSLTVSLCVGMSNFILLPTMGALSDKVGRRFLLITASACALLTGYPAMLWMIGNMSFTRLLIVELWFSLVYATYNGVVLVYLTEIMPAKVRTTSFGLAYSLAVAIFGGFTPAICTWLIHWSGNRAAPGIWLSFAALLSLTAILMSGRFIASISESP
ncbi:MAG TPA: tricarballylate/proton symporter TcuC [Acidobacteriaceae bacterium]|jgi:MFS family permease|nr:tricarballylate/proton symporter TcuC [Acidobacteriaceae bacterium]